MASESTKSSTSDLSDSEQMFDSIGSQSGLVSFGQFQSRVNAVIQILYSLRPVRDFLLSLPPLPGLDCMVDDLKTLSGLKENGFLPVLPSFESRYSVLKGILNCFFSFKFPANNMSEQKYYSRMYVMEEYVEELEEILQFILAVINEVVAKLNHVHNKIPPLMKIIEKHVFYTNEKNPIIYEKDSSGYFLRFQLKPHIKNIYDSFTDRASMKTQQMYKEFFDGSENCEVKNKDALYLPPVVFIRLFRLEEFNLGRNSKKSSRNSTYEFYEDIDLSKYARDRKDGSSKQSIADPQLYTLFTVVSETKNSSKCPVFIRDGKTWAKYEDEIVTPCAKEEAIEGNYGSEPNEPQAQLLGYVRKNLITDTDVEQSVAIEEPSGLSPQVLDELKTLALKKFGKRGAVYRSVLLLTEDTFRENVGLNMFQEPGPLPALHVPIPHSQLVEVRTKVRTTRFYEIVAHVLKCQSNRLRIWVLYKCMTRQNVVRPILLSQDYLSSVFREEMQDEVLMFVEKYTYDPIPAFNLNKDCLVILKEFYAEGLRLMYLGCIYAPWSMTFENLFREILGERGLQKSETDRFRVYHEIGGNDFRQDLVKPVTDFSLTLHQGLRTDESMGEILIIDWATTADQANEEGSNSDSNSDCDEDQEAHPCTCLNKITSADAYVRFLKNKRTIEFVNLFLPKESHRLEINSRICCGSLPTLLEEKLGISVKNIRLFECQKFGQSPSRGIHYDDIHKRVRLATFLPTDAEVIRGAKFQIFYVLDVKF